MKHSKKLKMVCVELTNLDPRSCWPKGYNSGFCVLMITKCIKLFGTNQIQECFSGFKEDHDGMCRARQPGPKLRDWLRRLGYYWLKMIPDTIAFAKRCRACQIHGDFVHQAPRHLYPTSSSWIFEMCEMDVIGPSSLQHPEDITSC